MEGEGKMSVTADGMLCVETVTPTVVWIKKELPGDVTVEFDAMTSDKGARAILMFLAKGQNGESVFAWTRKGDYAEYAFGDKVALYSIGMLRGFTGEPSNIRKLGANSKPEWRKLAFPASDKTVWPSVAEYKAVNEDFQKGSILRSAPDGCALGKWHHFTCAKTGASIKYLVDGRVVFDLTDDGSFSGRPLDGGWIGFRNFGKGTRIFYGNVLAVGGR
jgi:hypothetical protein